jgi:hypothetical protein
MSLSTYLVLATAAGAGLFVILYALLAPFYRSESGWNLMSFMLVVATMVTMAVYYRLTGERAPSWLQNVLWGAAAGCVWWRVVILLRAQLSRPSPK